MREGLAGVKTEGNEAKTALRTDKEADDNSDPAHHAHALGNGGHAGGAAELALAYEGGGLLGLNN